ncbi:MAG: hypothetical protein ACI8S3_000355 [Alphaproteobacteria bacterium]|jgi:hypothetical protein
MKAEFDSDDFLTRPNFHDGYLKGIMLEANDQLSLHCEITNSTMVQILIPRVSVVHANNFREGNIILGFRIYTGEQYRREMIGQADNSVQQFREDIDQGLSKIAEHGWSLFELVSSYGCELLVLFDGKREDVKFIAA